MALYSYLQNMCQSSGSSIRTPSPATTVLTSTVSPGPPSPNVDNENQDVQNENVRVEFPETWLWLDFKMRWYKWRLVLPFSPFVL